MIPAQVHDVEHSTPDAQPLTSPSDDEPSSTIDPRNHPPASERLSELAERAAAILERWTVAGERHERAVSQLESQLTEFEVTSARLQRDTSQKMQDLERAVHHEWTALREVHEEPIRQLREQANSLTEVCIATAHSAQRGFDQAEARLAAIEAEMQHRITELRREVQHVVGELRSSPGLPPAGANPSAWPLDDVTRLHHQLRQGAETVPDLPVLETTVAVPPSRPAVDSPVRLTDPVPEPRPPTTLPPSGAPDLSDRVRVLERALDERDAETREASERAQRSTSASRRAMIGMGAVLVLAAGLVFWMQSQVSSRVEDAQRRSQEATEAAAKATIESREQAAREIAAARELASRAQTVSAVLAAPDLIRFNLISTNQNSAGSAQALWSRTRGLVLSGSRLAPLPEGKAYQVWLLARGQAMNAGTFVPDETGSATLAVAAPSTTLPIISVVVSLEPTGGSSAPVGPPVLVRSRVEP